MFVGTIQEVWRYPVKSMAGERLVESAVQSLGIPGDRGWALRDETSREITNGKRIPLLMQCAARYRNEPTDGAIPPVDITFPNGSVISSDDPAVNVRLSEALGKNLTLWPRLPASNKAHYRRANLSARIFGRFCRFSGFRAMLPVLTRYGTINSQLRDGFSREDYEPIPDISVLPANVLEFTSPPGTYFDAFPVHVLTTASLEAMRRFNPAADWDVRRFRPNFLIKSADGLEGLTEPEWAGKTLRIGSVEMKCEIPTMRCGMTMQAQADLPKDPSVLRSIVKDANQNLGVYANVVNSGVVSQGDRVELM
jgi:uncharacterized protein YcbX